MIPEFNVKRLNTKVSTDFISMLAFYVMILVTAVFWIISTRHKGPIHLTTLIPFIVILAVNVLETITHWVSPTKNMKAFQSGGVVVLAIFNISVAVGLIFYLPLYSPFLLVLASMLFITIYYRGLSAWIMTIFVVMGIVGAYTWLHGVPAGPDGYLYPISTVVLAAATGAIIARAGVIDDNVRKEFFRVSRGIEVEREELSTLINSIPAAVIATDRSGNVLFYNNNALTYLVNDERQNSLTKKAMIKMFDKRELPIDLIALASAQKTQKVHLQDLYTVLKDKEKLYLEADISPIISKTDHGQAGYIIILRDITKEKSLAEERNEFVSVASHELRTPIATAEASLSLLLNPKITDNLDPKLRDRIKISYDSIIYLADLTNQLAILSQAEDDDLDVTFEQIEIQKLVDSLVKEFGPQADKKGLRLVTRLATGLTSIRNSKTHVEEILRNFLSNGIKFTEKGDVVLEVTQANNGEEVIFSVKDTGIGIGVSDREKIFTKYYRAEDFRTRNTNGNGLGLYLSSRLASTIRGKIWFSSELNKGSTFYLQIPAITGPNQIAPPKA